MGWEDDFSQHYLEHGFEILSELPGPTSIVIFRFWRKPKMTKKEAERMVQFEGKIFPANRFKIEGAKRLLWAIYRHHLFFFYLMKITRGVAKMSRLWTSRTKLTWFEARLKKQLHRQYFFAQPWLITTTVLWPSYHREQIAKDALHGL